MAFVCLGQASVGIGSDCFIKGSPGPVLVSPVKCDGALQFESSIPKSFFTLPAPNSSTMETLVEAMLKSLETQDSPSSVGILMDATSGLGSSLGSALLNELSELLPGLSLNVGMIYNSEKDCLHGLGAYNSLLSTQSAIKVADFVLYRGLSETTALGAESLEDTSALLSTDMMLALHPSLSWNDCEGFHTKSLLTSLPYTLSGSKLIDVRSSLWKVSLNNRASKAEKYNPIRSMSVNLHAQYVQANPENQQHEEVVNHAYLHYASLPCSEYTFGRSSSTKDVRRRGRAGAGQVATGQQQQRGGNGKKGLSVSKKDVHANLKWAMPSVSWLDLEMSLSPPSPLRDSSNSSKGDRNRNEEDVDIATMCYASPYSRRLVVSSLQSVGGLLKRKAYLHYLLEAGLEEADIDGCIESVRSSIV